MRHVAQGTIIELSNEKKKAIVLSKDFFNQSGLSVVCPIVLTATEDVLHIPLTVNGEQVIALCEHLKTVDLAKRHYKTIGTITYAQIQEVTDVVQAIFDYYPYGRS